MCPNVIGNPADTHTIHTDSHMCTDTCYTKHTLFFMWKKTVVLSDNDGTHIFSH